MAPNINKMAPFQNGLLKQLVRANLRIFDIVEVPGENVALHVPCEQSVPIDRHASDLLFMVEASQALASLQIPQLSNLVQSVAYY